MKIWLWLTSVGNEQLHGMFLTSTSHEKSGPKGYIHSEIIEPLQTPYKVSSFRLSGIIFYIS